MQRVLFVDVLRLLALLQMINGHTLDAVLEDAARVGGGFETYRFVRGLVSVAFLVVAGVSFYLTTLARFDQHRADPSAVRRRFVRAGEIILIGYLLQLRWPSAYLDPAQREAALRALLRCEVLQCIGLCLIALETTALFARSARQVVGACAIAALAMFSLSPYTQLATLHQAPSLWAGWVGHGTGSQFPILPWGGYVLAGVVLARVALPESGRTPLARRLLGFAGAATVCFALAMLARRVPHPPVLASSATWFVVEKLAVIALTLGMLALLTQRIRRLPAALNLLGAQTLAIFVFHLQVIYGTHLSLGRVFARSLPLWQALCASLLNLALSIAFAFAWSALKRQLQTLRGSRPSALLTPAARSAVTNG